MSHPRMHIFHVHNAITACLTQLSMNFDWFHATQVEESDNHALSFKCKRRHFSMKNTTATRPRHKNSTGSTVLPLGLVQPKEQPRLLQQLSRFYLLPFPRKKLGYLRTWTPHVYILTHRNIKKQREGTLVSTPTQHPKVRCFLRISHFFASLPFW